MRTSCLLVALGSVVFSSPAWGVDYSKVDRTIAKEPAYQKSPRYALLLFGPEAKVRVWAAVDGETLYLDRSADGDLTGNVAFRSAKGRSFGERQVWHGSKGVAPHGITTPITSIFWACHAVTSARATVRHVGA